MITAQSACGPYETACGCMGPQNGQPLCPCQMRGVKIVNGRYVRTQDLGPAPDSSAQSLLKDLAAQQKLMPEGVARALGEQAWDLYAR